MRLRWLRWHRACWKLYDKSKILETKIVTPNGVTIFVSPFGLPIPIDLDQDCTDYYMALVSLSLFIMISTGAQREA